MDISTEEPEQHQPEQHHRCVLPPQMRQHGRQRGFKRGQWTGHRVGPSATTGAADADVLKDGSDLIDQATSIIFNLATFNVFLGTAINRCRTGI